MFPTLAALVAPALAGPTLAVSGPCPGPVTLTAMDLTPDTEFAIILGRAGLGDDDLPAGPCEGDDSDVADIVVVGAGKADATGSATLRPRVPAPACGTAVQLVDLTSCRDTNAVRFVGDGLFEPDAIPPDLVFENVSLFSPSTIAWDGDYWWHGLNGDGPLLYYGREGSWLGTGEPPMITMSVFAKGDGSHDVFLRPYEDYTIWEPAGFGVWAPTGPTLVDDIDILGVHRRVAYDPTRSHYVANLGGRVGRWDESGASVGVLELDGYGDYGFEYDRHIVAVAPDGTYLTYADGVVSAWDPDSGERLDRVVLVGSDWDYTAVHTFSYTNGRAMVYNTVDGHWYGYPLGL